MAPCWPRVHAGRCSIGAQVLGVAALGYGVRAIPIGHLLSFVALTVLGAAASVMIFNHQATDFLLRTQDLGTSDTWRIDTAFLEWLDVAYKYPLGMGLGTGHQAFYQQIPANLWETELSRLAFELGLGFFYIAFKVTLIGQLLARMKASRTRAGRTMLATCAVISIPSMITGSVYWPLANAAFWAFVGTGFWVVSS